MVERLRREAIAKAVAKSVAQYGKTPSNPFKKGHKKKGGRRPGSPNRITTQVKDIILEATAMYGRNGKGKDGAVGYLYRIARDHPELMVRLLEKLIPLQVTGKGGGPIQIMALPQDVLRQLSPEQQAVLQAAYETMAAKAPAASTALVANASGVFELPGDGDAYAESIGLNGSGKDAS